jgi:hypothetical protein
MVLAHKLALKIRLKYLEWFLSFFTKLLHCLNVKKNPTIYGASQFGSMPSTIEPIEAHIAIYIYISMQILSQRHNLLYIILKNSPCICLWTR